MKRMKKGVTTVKHFGDIWNSRQAADYNLRRLVEDGLAEIVGGIPWMGAGQFLRVFAASGQPYRRNQLLHDAMVHLAALRIDLPYTLAPHTDAVLEPDITWVCGEYLIHGDLCTGSSSYKDIREERYTVYENCTDLLLWIIAGWWGTAEATRLEKMLDFAKGTAIADIAWFGTLTDVLGKGREATFLSCDDREITITELLAELHGSSKPETPKV